MGAVIHAFKVRIFEGRTDRKPFKIRKQNIISDSAPGEPELQAHL
jgi:hypothetical protein